GTLELTNPTGLSDFALNPTEIAVLGSHGIFAAPKAGTIGASGFQTLFVTDGTPAGPHEVAVSGTFGSNFGPYDLTVFGDQILFGGRDSAGRYGLWTTNGTDAGTVEIFPGGPPASNGLDPFELTVAGNKVIFEAGNHHNTGLPASLWVTDGTGPGTMQ